jgi:uncharacterized membrane protein SirB2
MLEYYGMIKHIHMSTAFLSLALFFLRGNWMIFRPERLQQRWVKIVPHVNDTVLLLSAIVLAGILAQLGGSSAWLAGKVIGLIVYIALGMVALKYGRSLRVRVFAFIGALITFAYILSVAFTKQTWPF